MVHSNQFAAIEFGWSASNLINFTPEGIGTIARPSSQLLLANLIHNHPSCVHGLIVGSFARVVGDQCVRLNASARDHLVVFRVRHALTRVEVEVFAAALACGQGESHAELSDAENLPHLAGLTRAAAAAIGHSLEQLGQVSLPLGPTELDELVLPVVQLRHVMIDLGQVAYFFSPFLRQSTGTGTSTT